MWHDLVHMETSPGGKALRMVAVCGALLVLLHLAGKRQLAQLSSFDLERKPLGEIARFLWA